MDNNIKLCKNCMEEIGDNFACPHCGTTKAQENEQYAMPTGTVVAQRYLVGLVKDRNSATIKYAGFDLKTNQKVEISELYCQKYNSRAENKTEVVVAEENCEKYKDIKNSFLVFSRKLARLRELTAIEVIYDIFEQNNTAYTICLANEGETLSSYLAKNGGKISWEEARVLFMPLISTLNTIHQSGFGHYGICAKNIIVTNQNKLKLVGFAFDTVRKTNSEIGAELFDGYSALEQYNSNSFLDEQTDIYGFTAVLFTALTGQTPDSALERKDNGKLLIDTETLETIPKHIVYVLSEGLQVNRKHRIQSLEALREELSSAPTVAVKKQKTTSSNTIKYNNYAATAKERKVLPDFVVGIISFLVALLVFSIIAWGYLITITNDEKENSSSEPTSSVTSSQVSSVPPVSENTSSEIVIGVNQIAAPNLLGESLVNAQNSATYQVLVTDRVFSDSIAEGLIISQSIKEGLPLDKGGIVTVVVSKGSEKRALPKIAGMSIDEARNEIAKNGLLVGKIKEEESTLKVGTVIGYANADYKEGTIVNYGTTIDILSAIAYSNSN